MTDFTWPQSGDWADAANFAFADRKENVVDYVEEGLNFTVDYVTPAVDISAGKAIVSDPSADSSNTGETRNNVAYAVWLNARSGVGLTDAAVNHIWMDAQVGSDDSPRIVVNTDNTQPTSHSIKIGEIDTSNDTSTELNRAPTGRFQSIGLSQGSNDEFEFDYDLSADELVLRDTENDVELFRQPKQGPMTFLQGIDAGSIEAPEDSYTQILNSAITSSSASGDTVGYTFAVNNSTGYALQGESDGSGGLTRIDHEFRDSAGSTLFSVRDAGPVEVNTTNLQLSAGGILRPPNTGADALNIDAAPVNIQGYGTTHLRVNRDAPVEILNTDFKLNNAVDLIQEWDSNPYIEQRHTNAGSRSRLYRYDTYAAIELSNDGGTSYTRYLQINQGGGPVEIRNADLDIDASQFLYIGGQKVAYSNGSSQNSYYIPNSSGAKTVIYDDYNSQNLMNWNEGGPIEVVNTNLEVVNTTGTEVIGVPVYATESDLPSASEGSIAYVSDTGQLYVEDGS